MSTSTEHARESPRDVCLRCVLTSMPASGHDGPRKLSRAQRDEITGSMGERGACAGRSVSCRRPRGGVDRVTHPLPCAHTPRIRPSVIPPPYDAQTESPDHTPILTTKPTKLQRWLDLVAFLAGRHFPVSTDEVWAHVPAYAAGSDGTAKEKASVRRTFERDKDELREMGIPIETVIFKTNWGMEESSGYQLARKDFHLPYLRMIKDAEATSGGGSRMLPPSAKVFDVAEQEAGAALDGLRELSALPAFPVARHARAAFRKLAFDLEPEMVSDAPVLYAADPEAVGTSDVLKDLSDALRRRKTLRFGYRAMSRDEVAVRDVRPYGLLFQHGRWYLVAHDESRDDVRMFRVGRMTDATPNAKSPNTPDYAVPADFDLSTYSGRNAWELGEDPEGPIEAEVLFRFPRSLWAERNEHGRSLEAHDDGGQLRGFTVHRREPFLRWVLSLEGDARVTAPDDLRDAFRQMVAAVAQRYAVRTEGEDDA